MMPSLPPAPVRVMDDALAYTRTMLVYIAQKLKIPDFIANESKTVAEIAEYTKTQNVENVERLMYALAAIGYFKLEKELMFSNNEMSSCLRRDNPLSMAGMIGHNVEDCLSAWFKLPNMFGPNPIECPWDEVFPQYAACKGKGGFFGLGGYLQSEPNQEEQFGRAMSALEGLGGDAMAKGAPFQKFKRIIDVGGSRGHFLIRLLKMHPEAKGVLMDREAVITLAQEANGKDGEINAMEERIEYFGGDFFNQKKMPKIEDGDVLVMRYILHDWSDEDALKILKTLRGVIGEKKASIMIGECAMPDRDQVGIPPTVHVIDIHMMSIFGKAKERTPKQWKEMLADAGFKMRSIHPTESLLHWVEAEPINV